MNARSITIWSRALAGPLALLLATALPAAAAGGKTGTQSLAAVLAADGAGFDDDPNDYDILDNAVAAVLAAKPDSPVALLADGKVALTAFLPRDRAFALLAEDIAGTSFQTEADVFGAVAGLGIDAVETVLLYHVVPGATIPFRAALKSDGAVLDTALAGSTIRVNVVRHKLVRLRDADTDDRNPQVVKRNINQGNRQIAHGIDRVLRPIDLP